MHPITAWAAESLRIPPGHRNAGRPLRLPAFADRWLRRSAPRRVRESLLSTARKNAKSTLIAVAGLYYLVGPGARPGWRGLVAGPDAVRSGETADLAEALALANGLAVERRYHPAPPGRLVSKTGRLDFLSGSGSGGHAAGADLAVLDEVGLCAEKHRPLLSGLRTSTSARDGKLWLLGVRSVGPFVAEFEARAAAGDPAVHVAVYTASPDRDLDDPAGWREANPALGKIKPLARMRADARRAAESPEDRREFEQWELNREVDATARDLVIDAGVFAAQCVADPDALPDRAGPVAVALDIGSGATMSAAGLYWPQTGRCEVYGAVAAEPPLARRGRGDGVGDRYERMAHRGELWALGRAVLPLGAFLERLRAVLPAAPVIVAADRNRRPEVESAIADAGLAWRPKWRSTAEGAADLAEFQRRAHAGELRLAESLLLAGAILDSEVLQTPSGGRIQPSRRHGRPQPIAALVRAVGVGAVAWRRRPRAPRIHVVGGRG